MKWKKPSMIFVNSMSDLFHEDVPFIFIDAVFSVMSDIDHHIYQVLTKRPQRMLEFFKWKSDEFGIPWQPKPNVWLGVSVEDQKAADERIPLLLQVPAAVRFLSCEPLLALLTFGLKGCLAGQKALLKCPWKENTIEWTALRRCSFNWHWVICGGESGPRCTAHASGLGPISS
jgi:protein gp37